MITINCETKDTLNLDELTEFQGELKKRTEKDVAKIIKSIRKHGFSIPFYVWQHDGINHVLDGHGRLMSLKSLKNKGEEIPPLPVVYVNCRDEAEAKELLLKINSQFGKMTKDSVLGFLDGLEINFEELELPKGILEIESVEIEDNPYTTKIETPIYEIKGEEPGIDELFNNEKFVSLCEEIDKKDIPEEIKKFLKMAATRHIVFHYGKIAEFYAHQNKEIQELFENSALVIIDYDKAIENGYVKMTQDLEKLLNGGTNA